MAPPLPPADWGLVQVSTDPGWADQGRPRQGLQHMPAWNPEGRPLCGHPQWPWARPRQGGTGLSSGLPCRGADATAGCQSWTGSFCMLLFSLHEVFPSSAPRPRWGGCWAHTCPAAATDPGVHRAASPACHAPLRHLPLTWPSPRPPKTNT